MQSAVFFIGTAGQPTIGDEIECSDLAVVAEAEEDRRKRAGIDVLFLSPSLFLTRAAAIVVFRV